MLAIPRHPNTRGFWWDLSPRCELTKSTQACILQQKNRHERMRYPIKSAQWILKEMLVVRSPGKNIRTNENKTTKTKSAAYLKDKHKHLNILIAADDVRKRTSSLRKPGYRVPAPKLSVRFTLLQNTLQPRGRCSRSPLDSAAQPLQNH